MTRFDEELQKFIDRLVTESQNCLDETTVDKLVSCSLRGKGLELINLPGGLRAYIPCYDAPEVWSNVLHIYCYRDYMLVEGFEPEKGWVVLDVGAYIGLYTIYAAHRVGGKGLVVAVEPYTPRRRVLERNVELNGFVDRVRVDPRALWVREGIATLHVACYPGNNSLVANYVEGLSEKCGEAKVRTVTFKTLVKDHKLEHIDLVKIDIEGAEELILHQLPSSIVERVVVEVHPPVSNVENVKVLLEKLGFKTSVYILEGCRQLMVYAWR